MIAIDTNLLVYAHRRATAEHRQARRSIEKAANDRRGWGITLQCVAEFYCVVTHPAAAGGPARPEVAASFLSNLHRDAGMHVWCPGTGFEERLLQMAGDLAVSGARIFDLQIALTAFEHGAAELWTNDHAFVKIPGLRLVHPL